MEQSPGKITFSHKLSFDKFKKIEIVLRIFFNYNAMRLEINYRKKTEKNKHKKVKQNVINQWISEKKLKENLKIPRQLTMKT